MKKLLQTLVIFLLVLLPMMLLAAAPTASETVVFQWEQEGLEVVRGWNLYWSSESGKGYEKIVSIPYEGGTEAVFSSSHVLEVSGEYGSTVTKYFVMRTVGKEDRSDGSENESEISNEISHGFRISWPTPSGPFNLVIKIEVSRAK